VSVLLRAGARVGSTNNMGKTAATMAAFVGQILVTVGLTCLYDHTYTGMDQLN